MESKSTLGKSCLLLILAALWAPRARGVEQPQVLPQTLKVAWNASAAVHSLKAWTPDELSRLSSVSTREKDPRTGKLIRWRGVLVSKWIEKELVDLPLEQRSQVDLLVFRNSKGEKAIIPRYLLQKYPVILGYADKSKESLTVVIPWTSRPQIRKEDLPLEAYQISDVNEIQLCQLESHFGSLLLKHRGDPAAIRGEKLVVQNCVGCHEAGRARSMQQLFGSFLPKSGSSSFEHPASEGGPRMSSRDLRAFTSYVRAYQAENTSPVGQRVGSATSSEGRSTASH